ncbi:FAD-linked oxidoreductase [Pseudonocardia thermophila]|uniref:FAD-linked oxidoreductase n=1 Tax=Pseudonocardia thermophila TaxID=1848 RepID=A0A1M6Y757_PSETH|nr:D-arabinono-1,4-lactone oxidase [Pseudonocardia thermophila]SHL14003.1 FAD-linked oxidoreductase [Pseudonocardia thermophila]
MPARSWRNWAGAQRTDPVRAVVARGAGEVADAVQAAARDGLRVKAIGSGHSFSAIGVADGVAVVVSGDPRDARIDSATGLVTVPAGITLRRLNRLLWEHGLALPNLGDIQEQTIAGALATGTHGTGAAEQCIAAQVRALDIVLADGSLVHCSPTEEPELFSAARVGLGALGILVNVTLQAVPAFRLHAVEQVLPLDEVLAELDAYVDGNDHFEFYWFPHTDVAATKRNNRTEATAPRRGRLAALVGDELLGNVGFGLTCRIGEALPSLVPRINRFVAPRMSAGEYVDRSYEVFCSPRRVRFVEMEYAVPRAAVHEAIAGLRGAAERHARAVTFPVEVRFLGADDIPLSTASGRDTVYIAVHVHRGQPHEAYFGAVESVMTALHGRPHWGKLHTRTAAQLRTVYPGFDDFVALRDRLDPERRFTNPYLERVLG